MTSPFLYLLLAFAVGFFLGYWRGRKKAGQRVLDYWLTAGDGRVNWSRVTAATGLGVFLLASAVVLRVYDEVNGSGMDEALLFVIGGACGMAGINLGQYFVSKRFQGPPPATNGTERQSGAAVTPET